MIQTSAHYGSEHPLTKGAHISTSIFVGNLSFAVTEQELLEAFGGVGRVARVRIVTDRDTGRSRGFAFVEFASDADADEAIRRFDGQPLGGRKLRVNKAEARRPGPRPQSFGGGGGGGGGGGEPMSYDTGPDSGFGAGRPFKNKGSRRGLRGRKRSLR